MPDPMVDPMMSETSVHTETERFDMASNTTSAIVYYNHQTFTDI